MIPTFRRSLNTEISNDVTAAVCFFFSGFASLACEICWIRQSSLVFGVATLALSTVLAVFFGGLAAGSYAAGRWGTRLSNPLRAYAKLELLVGLLVILSPAAFQLADTIFGKFYWESQGIFWRLAMLRAGLLALVLCPPAVLMGATLPLFCRHFVRSHECISWSVGWLYGINTLGAAIGCGVCGFYFLPHWGVTRTLMTCGSINVLLGLTMLRAKAPPVAESAPLVDERRHSGPIHRAYVIGALFFVTGFLALGNEILWARFLSLVLHNTVYTYTVTLTVVLVGIVIGSMAGAVIFDRLTNREFFFGATQVAIGLVVSMLLFAPADFRRQWIGPVGLSGQLVVAGMLLLVPAILSGMTFPLAMRLACDHASQVSAGVGRLAALNTWGGILGSLAVGFVALPWLGLQHCVGITTGLSLAVGFSSWILLDGITRSPMKLLVIMATSAA